MSGSQDGAQAIEPSLALTHQAMRLCRELAGPEMDLWALSEQIVERAVQTGRPLDEAARDVIGAAWVVRAQGGDDDARARLVRIWRRDVLRWCRFSAGPGVDPQDAAQEALLRMLDRLHQVTEPLGFRSWLYAVTWRVLREQERGPWLRRWVLGTVLERWVDPAPSAEADLVSHERGHQVKAILEQLPLEARTLLWHAYVEGCTRARIAEIMGLPEGTVNRRLTRARAQFRTLAVRRGVMLEPTAALAGEEP